MIVDEVAFPGEFGKLKYFYHGHTYTGNNLTCTVPLANLEVFEKKKTLQGEGRQVLKWFTSVEKRAFFSDL